jgi:hypothetical protein
MKGSRSGSASFSLLNTLRVVPNLFCAASGIQHDLIVTFDRMAG